MGTSRTLLSCVIVTVLYVWESSGTELMLRVPPGRQECFYENVVPGKTFYVEYSVVETNVGDVDINFQLSDARGRPVVSEFRKRESHHEVPVNEEGLYRACFDNTFSHISHKTVAFYMSADGKDKDGLNRLNDYDLKPDTLAYQKQVEEIRAELALVYHQMTRVRGIQDQFRLMELKDRRLAENNFEVVNFWSSIYCVTLLVVGIVQVFVLRNLFEEKHSFKKFTSKFKS